MNVRLHIDRLVLDGLSLGAADRPHLQASVEAELTRLIAAGGIASSFASGAAVPAVRAPQMTFAPGAKPAQLGSAIAGAVYGGVGGKQR
jgi:hypothetical protein